MLQSFDYLTDTGLPGMIYGMDRKSGLNRFLTSWESFSDPAHGEFSIGFDPYDIPQVFLYKDSAPIYRIGPWNGHNLNAPDFSNVTTLLNYKFINNKEEVWQFWNEGGALEIVDSTIADSCLIEDVVRCIQVGQLCVQDNATDRPEMSSVIFILSNEVSIPIPKQPIFTIEKVNETGISSENEMTVTAVDVY
ncbi:hypothetical protein BUALT_Bualt03G0069400 [Buddleja alternifolia]|uniref:Uncharacterized protein n=1 Tax=Buddleja alternifolia TaxID=168488 RepID=A0AAV6XRL9_9LAMI|nr:hypothetical protein BUALT_Bualt03G0069400 [Buddleja alternifolia]